MKNIFVVNPGDIPQILKEIENSAKILNAKGLINIDWNNYEIIFFWNSIIYHYNNLRVKNSRFKSSSCEEEDYMEFYFEANSFLYNARIILDRSLNLVQLISAEDISASFNVYIKKGKVTKTYKLSKKFWDKTGRLIKDYRDCIVHYCLNYEGIFFSSFGDEPLLPDDPTVRSRKKLTFNKKILVFDYISNAYESISDYIHSLYITILKDLLQREFGSSYDIQYTDLPFGEFNELFLNESIAEGEVINLAPTLGRYARGKYFRVENRFIKKNGELLKVTIIPNRDLDEGQFPVRIEV